jgi:hypothetical protein
MKHNNQKTRQALEKIINWYNDYMSDPIDDMPNIETGNGIDRNLAATTNDRLKKTVWELRNQNALTGEMIRQQRETTVAEKSTKTSLDALTKTIKELDSKNGKLQYVIVGLTVATVILAIVQVWVSFRQPQVIEKVVEKPLLIEVTPSATSSSKLQSSQ